MRKETPREFAEFEREFREWENGRETLKRVRLELRNLSLLSIINFIALLWVIYVVGGR